MRRRAQGTDLVGSQLARRAAPAAPPATMEERIADLLRHGRKIEAIKVYREATSANLADAKRAVERFETGNPLSHDPLPPVTPSVLDDAAWRQLRDLTSRGQKIQAIKLYRDLTGANLRDAKNAIDSL
ncbi:hypothetical protein ACFQX7_15270 [Luedemannella flava]